MIAQDLEALISQNLQELVPEISLAYIFGSQVDGTATPESDIDIAFLSKLTTPNIRRFDIAQELSERLKLDVDLVDLREAGAPIKTEVIMKGLQLLGTKLEADLYAMYVLKDYQHYKYHVVDIERQILEDIRS